jgi:hypothetical protein
MGIPWRPSNVPHDDDDRPEFRPDRRWLYALVILVALLIVAVFVSILLFPPPLAH